MFVDTPMQHNLNHSNRTKNANIENNLCHLKYKTKAAYVRLFYLPPTHV